MHKPSPSPTPARQSPASCVLIRLFDYVFFSVTSFFFWYAVVLVVGLIVRIVHTTMSRSDGGPEE
jgi:hypothetical protein